MEHWAGYMPCVPPVRFLGGCYTALCSIGAIFFRVSVRSESPSSSICPRKLRHSETVKNITVSVPDQVYRDARIAAAQRDTSVSALVVAYLQRLAGWKEEFGRLEALQHEVQAGIGQFRAADRLGRDEVHDRTVH
jgi:hypothetical protein